MRRELAALAALGALLFVGWYGYDLLFVRDARVTLTEVKGDVRHGDRAAQAGEEVDARARVVAGEDGSAVLSFGAENRLALGAGASVRVLEVDESGVRIELEEGRVQATVRPGGGSLGVVTGSREFVADDADFAAVRQPDGTVGVEALRGDVAVRGVEGTDRVREGEQFVASEDGSTLVGPVSESLLRVVTPAGGRTRETTAEVRGTTRPHAKVRVGDGAAWTEVAAGADGSFVARIPLVEGPNALRVEARDIFGHTAVTDVRVVRDTLPPSIDVGIRY